MGRPGIDVSRDQWFRKRTHANIQTQNVGIRLTVLGTLDSRPALPRDGLVSSSLKPAFAIIFTTITPA